MLRAVCMTSASRVNSSTTFSNFNARPSAGLVELEVKRPHVPGALGTQKLLGGAGVAQAAALAGAPRDPQPFLAPQALHALAVDLPALLLQMGVRLAVPHRGRFCREGAQFGA